jgi:glutathione S-transferase
MRASVANERAPTLVSLHVSPWSERAKWALDHHGLAYKLVHHLPVFGEGRLRRLVGPDKPRATVPVLVAGDTVVSESWDIAAYADRVGSRSKLIPPEHEAAIRRWTTLADETMQAGRQLVLGALLRSPAGLDEASPSFVPAWMRPLSRPVARQITRALLKKYPRPRDDDDADRRALRPALDEIRRAREGGAPFLLGSFTYADIVMATMLQAISPVDDRFIRLGPATRLVWTQAALAKEYADLIAWRDELYARQRRATA